MELRRDVDYALGAILLGGLILALITISLFSRMAPAIEQIRQDNVTSFQASHKLLAVFTAHGGEELTEKSLAKIDVALDDLRKSITVLGEERYVDLVTDAVLRAQIGDPHARRDLVAALSTILDINAEAMAQADREARRLGVAGAWVTSMGGVFILLMGLFARARLRRRVVAPLREVARVLDAHSSGDHRARCQPVEGAIELERLLRRINWLLDMRFLTAESANENIELLGDDFKGHPLSNEDDEGGPQELHASALVGLLDQREGAWVVYSAKKGLVSANLRALSLLSKDQALANRLQGLKSGESDLPKTPLPGKLFLVALDAETDSEGLAEKEQV